MRDGKQLLVQEAGPLVAPHGREAAPPQHEIAPGAPLGLAAQFPGGEFLSAIRAPDRSIHLLGGEGGSADHAGDGKGIHGEGNPRLQPQVHHLVDIPQGRPVLPAPHLVVVVEIPPLVQPGHFSKGKRPDLLPPLENQEGLLVQGSHGQALPASAGPSAPPPGGRIPKTARSFPVARSPGAGGR